MTTSTNSPVTIAPKANQNDALNCVVKKLGGRHLIFRTQLTPWKIIPRPYALISDFSGPVWFFYGLGQIWITHKKYHEYDGWTARVSRIGSDKIQQLLDQLESPISSFTHYCNEHGIEGTIVIEPGIIEFHWTFGYDLPQEKRKPEKSLTIEKQFQQLVDEFMAAKSELRI